MIPLKTADTAHTGIFASVWTTFPVPSLRSATGFEFTCEWLVKKRRKFYAPGGLSPQNRGEPLMWSGNETSLKTSLVPRPFPPPGFDRLQHVETAHCKRSKIWGLDAGLVWKSHFISACWNQLCIAHHENKLVSIFVALLLIFKLLL